MWEFPYSIFGNNQSWIPPPMSSFVSHTWLQSQTHHLHEPNNTSYIKKALQTEFVYNCTNITISHTFHLHVIQRFKKKRRFLIVPFSLIRPAYKVVFFWQVCRQQINFRVATCFSVNFSHQKITLILPLLSKIEKLHCFMTNQDRLFNFSLHGFNVKIKS